VSPNPLIGNNIVNNGNARRTADCLGYSLEKRTHTAKSFYNSFEVPNSVHPRYNNLYSTEPSHGVNKRVVSNIHNPIANSTRANDSRSHSLEKNTVPYSKNFVGRGIKLNNTSLTTSPNTSHTAPTANSNSAIPVPLSSETHKAKLETAYMVLRQPHTAQSVLLPGILSFKEAVNCLHYCRLLYKFLMLSREVEEHDRRFASVLSALLFKVLSEIANKIEKKEIAYDEETNKKETKLREVSSEYYRKYSNDVEKPFNR
jgi:hypothetical protein